MNKNLHDEQMKLLFEAVLSLENHDECSAFFDDLCTIGELAAMAQRYSVAILLRQGIPYHDIARQTGASTATISRVNRALQYGADGYKLVLGRKDNE